MKRWLRCTDLALLHFFFFWFFFSVSGLISHGFFDWKVKGQSLIISFLMKPFVLKRICWLCFLTYKRFQRSGVTDDGPGVFQQTTAQMDCWGCVNHRLFPTKIQKSAGALGTSQGSPEDGGCFGWAVSSTSEFLTDSAKTWTCIWMGCSPASASKHGSGTLEPVGERLANPSHPAFPQLPAFTSVTVTCSNICSRRACCRLP